MKLSTDEALARLVIHDHGVLATRHDERGVDAVPIVYALHDDHLGVPIDRVKPKASNRLQRERNLEVDPRATLLIDHWDRDDWSRLWWVRAELRWAPDASPELVAELGVALADRYRHYADQPFHRLLTLRIVGVTGWAAS